MSSYENKQIGSISVDDESTYPNKLGITVSVDSHEMCTIRFENSMSVRIPAGDLFSLRDLLYDASREMMMQISSNEGFDRVKDDNTNKHSER